MQPDRAEQLAVAAIDHARDAGDPWLAAWGRYALAIARGRADPADALTRFEHTISAFEATGDRLNAARVTMFLGHGARIFGDARSSDDAFARAAAWCADVGAAPVTQLDCELGRAQSADVSGRRAEAAQRYRALIPRLWELGDHRCAAVAQRNLAAIVAADGDLEGAAALVSSALEAFSALPMEETELATTFLVRAEIAELRDEAVRAATLLGRARFFAGGGGVPVEVRDLDRMDALHRRMVERFGEESVRRLEDVGANDRTL